jgi:electron transfer flavoprotein beta subunit
MRIVVCIKQIPDPEAHPECVKVDSEARKVNVIGLPPVINPFDENALEAAATLREKYNGEVIAVTAGSKLSKNVLRKILAGWADRLIAVEDEQFENLDSFSTAYILSKLIERVGEFDIIFTGRQAGDWDSGQTGQILAEILEIPCINFAQKIEVDRNVIRVEKIIHGGYEILETEMPVLITVGNEIGEPRYVSISALKAARKRPIEVLTAEDIGIEPEKLKKLNVVELFSPSLSRECIMMDGESDEERSEKLAIRLLQEVL